MVNLLVATQPQVAKGNNMLNKREALKGLTHTRSVSVSVSSNDLPDNTISFVMVSDDNGGTRYDWGSDEYYTEELDINGASVDRLNTFFKDHVRSVDTAIGKVSNVRVVDGQLVADVTFGSDADSQSIYSKYSEGILTDVSIGYEIRDYSVSKGADNELDTVLVDDYSIFELSAVGVGFDAGAKARSEKNIDLEKDSKMDKAQLERLEALEAQNKRNAEEKKELLTLQTQRDDADKAEKVAEMARMKAENAELKRVASIDKAHSDYNSSNLLSADIVRSFKEDKTKNAQDFKDAILAAREKETPAFIGKTDSSRSDMIAAMVDGLALRAGATLKDAHADAENYRYASLISIGNELLPEDKRSLNPNEIAERSLVTGDFPLLLQSAGDRVLTAEFQAQVGTYKSWIKETDVPDFRVMTDLTASVGGGRLDKTLENGDLKELSGNEAAETWNIASFGNKFVLTREMLINDDLGIFTNMLANFARMASVTANGISYDILQGKGDYANYKMADGSGVFVSARNNAATDALSSAAISAGRLAMSKHKSIDGVTPLNIVPKYLIVSPALEVQAREILGATNKIYDGADAEHNTGEINVNQGAYELIVDAEITSDTAWYMMADYRTIKIGYLAGTNRSPVVKMNDSTLIRTTYEGVYDLGVVVEDFKGLYRGNV